MVVCDIDPYVAMWTQVIMIITSEFTDKVLTIIR